LWSIEAIKSIGHTIFDQAPMAYKDRLSTPGLANATSNLEAPKHPSTEAQDLNTVMENQQNLVEVGVIFWVRECHIWDIARY